MFKRKFSATYDNSIFIKHNIKPVVEDYFCIKDNIILKKGKSSKFRFNGARNQIEEFDGIIEGVYNCIFTIRTQKNETKSFSYSDVLIGNLEILQ